MIKSLLDWLDDRTGYREFTREALYENIPGGARWRYVWGSTLVFVFMVQMITGVFLWMAYSPSAQTAWESVYYIQFEMTGGWLLRGIHHYAAQAMVVLMALHLMQVVIDGAYRAPREINFWLGLVLLKITLGLALTGYLLPWDQKGFWATQVATKIAGVVPIAGPWLQQLIVGGSEYGHHTLTRFFALHAGVLPGLLIAVLVVHVALFRRHGITVKNPDRGPDQFFWPDQVLKDAVACLAVLLTIGGLAVWVGAELGAPANPAEAYSAARPEWYFLFLFQFLKFFHGEVGEILGAIVIPGLVMLVFFLMPLIGRSRLGHRLNIVVVTALIAGSAGLTWLAIREDYQARWVSADTFAEVEQALDKIDTELRRDKASSAYHGKSREEQLSLWAQGNSGSTEQLLASYQAYSQYNKSQEYLEAVEQAKAEGHRAQQLAAAGIPPGGALALLRTDPKTQGPKLFRKHCASCHDHVDSSGHGIREPRPLEYPIDETTGKPDLEATPVPNGAPNLYGFASRAWLKGFLNPKELGHVKQDKETFLVTDAPYFGNTVHREGEMVAWVGNNLSDLDEEQQAQLDQVVIALSAEAALPAQRQADEKSRESGDIEAGHTALVEEFACTDCHKFGDEDPEAGAPDLTGYGSRQWLIDFLSNPAHERFYEESNDRMPAFAAGEPDDPNNLLDRQSLELLVDWLRGDWTEQVR